MLNRISRFYKKISIRTKLLLLFSVQIIIPIAFMGIMIYRNTRTIIQDKSIKYSIDILSMVKLRLNDFYSNLEDISDDLLCDPGIYEALSQKELDNQYDTFIHANNVLRRICLSRKEIQSIALVSKIGERYSYSLSSGRVGLDDQLPYDEMFKEVKGKQMPIWFLDKEESGAVKNIYFVRLIRDIDTFNEIGIMVIGINRDYLRSVYSDLSTEFMQNIAILTQSQEVLVGTTSLEESNFKSDFIINGSKNSDYYTDKSHGVLLCYMQVGQPEWKIVTESSLGKLNEELYRFRTWFILLVICTILILSIFSILMAIDMITPIKQLVEGIKKFEEENVHQEVVVDREDELGYLNKCFNKMSIQIDTLVNSVYKEQLTRKEAELKALQAQINPHFLFNTLESINWMAQLNNVPEIRDMVTSLGSIMEASIGKGSPLIPLRQELKYVESYILIMKNRYGERLTYEAEIDENLIQHQVPKLLLQPLVENAIYHGIDRSRKKGLIRLVVRKQEDSVYIEVMDNGKGMEEEELQLLNNKFQEVNPDYMLMGHRKGIGLENVNARIKLFFGPQYGLNVESEYGSYTKIKLTLPLDNELGGHINV
ncbi:two-component sensor histidine kinase [Sporanaerobium hydrogeniformans]|uniref:Two-component sensor histidine kinase n=1 Tax=Sporanaerobium hydrogeniformans TaxID=3072179 RepID=A0AC61DFS8_9FIRM|nr:sensor histidine kinase [Sporanaerobium hydrogeniformans]PHV71437.1 two-component sensor histidine kinase [Sporanaerobium hydrogeniformans]